MMEQVRGLQFKRLELNAAKAGGAKPAWFSIDSEEGEARAGDAAFASAIRTNLCKLARAEIAWSLGKRYAQDQPLAWGCATERAAQDMLAYCAPGATKKKRPPAERPEPVPQRSAE